MNKKDFDDILWDLECKIFDLYYEKKLTKENICRLFMDIEEQNE